MTKTIGILVGSLRKQSYSKIVAQTMEKLFPESYQTKVIEIGDLPLYNQDFDDEDQAPASYQRFRGEMKTVDAVLFVTPEYNRSIPAVLKNALDIGSRPYGQSVWEHKPAAIVSLSPGTMGGFGANHHLRQALVFLDMPTLQQPEAYLSNVTQFMNPAGTEITNPKTLQFLQAITDAFVKLIERY
ncbi:NAD(P)H-dependent oxidoreductase [Lactobacillus sp. DCY120]|uniref:NAD(P)H-dependent oxidoreductase n=1 Tax=Bombilactobacillus apium TaxID=2675299 RepID=A0A850R3W8_9LACO|nr:NAD(P)H-dependent oxidoreductase [Bombilactobacillus apium]NVY97060.1 NAD(P)H-dependent oxidoreductase [Bombilactobacillus apium]